MPRAAVLTLTIMALWLPAVGAAADVNTLDAAERRMGWRLLFDGTSTAGWRNFRGKNVSAGWAVRDGALVRVGAGAGDIITEDQFDSFELSIDYRISKAGNSGIMFHVLEDADATWKSGPEVQIQDNRDGHDPQKSGWLYQLYPPAPLFKSTEIPDATRPAGQWNTVQLRVTPLGGEIMMNGVRYSKFVKGSELWNEKVAQSKFSKFPQFGKASRGHLCLQDHGDEVAYRNIKIRALPVDGTPLEPSDETLEQVQVALAYPDLKWDGWEPVDAEGRQQPFRPVVATHAGDGSQRLFVMTQHGVAHIVPQDPQSKSSQIFLDITDRVDYEDAENEKGLLGLAFHPKFRDNGQFFVYYTARSKPLTSIISRFRVSKDDPNRADPASEEVLLRIPQPYWNHNGGTLAFGPDGYLYVGLGDGGAGNDPLGNGQNLQTLLGSILRIDVDHQDRAARKMYAVPKDNPFVNQPGAQPEIWSYGWRNIWRLSFDRETGDLWAADVGQNLWEEINLVTKGGNYGWSLREGNHPFGRDGSDARPDLIDPIWEYDHQVGLSITGGLVYRGRQVPALVGKYLFADYLTGKIWALHYDATRKKVLSVARVPSDKLAVLSFGEAEDGEVFLTIVAPDGKGLYRLAPK